MEKLSEGTVEGGGRSWDSLKWNLDIIRYTAQPNLVNSTNNHIGVTYCLKVIVDNVITTEDRKKFESRFNLHSMDKIGRALSSSYDTYIEVMDYLYSHTLTKILVCFDFDLQRPKLNDMQLVKNWPSISFNKKQI